MPVFRRAFALALPFVILMLSAFSHASCSIPNGTYGFSFHGLEGISPNAPLPISQFVPLAAAGTFTFTPNSLGNSSGSVADNHTVSYGGLFKSVSQTGTFQINETDCTGTASFELCPVGCPSPTTWNLVIVNGGREIRFLVTGDSRVIEGTMTKQ